MYTKFTSQSISFRLRKLCILISTYRSKFYENYCLFSACLIFTRLLRKFRISQVDPQKILGKKPKE